MHPKHSVRQEYLLWFLIKDSHYVLFVSINIICIIVTSTKANLYTLNMRKKVDLFILLLVIIVGFFTIKNVHELGDWAHGLTYDAPNEISTLADNATMNDKARKMFYRFSPTLIDQNKLDSTCGANKLGCAEKQSIYILDYTNKEELNQSTVTAAHEMLHIAYSRLSKNEKNNINQQLDEELKRDEANNINQKLDGYPEQDYYDEAHSFVGTELASISSELEEYYKQYFNDRSAIIDAFNKSP
jgi:hypothetical protein